MKGVSTGRGAEIITLTVSPSGFARSSSASRRFFSDSDPEMAVIETRSASIEILDCGSMARAVRPKLTALSQPSGAG